MNESLISELSMTITCQRTTIDSHGVPVAFAAARIELTLDPEGGKPGQMSFSFQQEFGSVPTPSVSLPAAAQPDEVVRQVLEQLRAQEWAPAPKQGGAEAAAPAG